MVRKAVVAVFVLTVILSGKFIIADEGMWTLNNLPLQELKDKYNFTPATDWIDHVQRSSARLPNCSASFVSGDGLIMTNWHCAEGAVQDLSTAENNIYEKGFYASTPAKELRTRLSVRVLTRIVDATFLVNDQMAHEYKNDTPADARQKAIKDIQMMDSRHYDLKCEIVVLYQGGQYQDYCYKIYDDVRLVLALERNVGFFGGDADNFEYPRYTLDVAFLRAYENGKPAKTPDHFKWSKSGPVADELIFVSGHPGRTARLLTSQALKTERDVRVPFLLDLFRRREATLQQFMLRGKEQYRIAESDLFGWQNSRKLYTGKIRGLQDPKLVEAKEYSENRFFSEFYLNKSVANNFANGLFTIGEAQGAIRSNYVKYAFLVRGFGFDSRLFNYARSIASKNKDLAQSVLDNRDGELPLDLEYEEAKLRDSLTHFMEVFGADDPLFSRWRFYGSGPADMAHKLVYGTALVNIDAHRRMIDGPVINLQQNDDPMVNFALHASLDGEPYEKKYNEALEQERRGYALLSDALFRAYGDVQYPDATFTLRLTFGKMLGYTEKDKNIPPFTTIGDAYKHSAEFGNAGDYRLPARWWQRKRSVNLKTPLDFVSNVDITGGNSGSPVFNKDHEIVGLIFDGNLQGLVSDYDYKYNPNARAIAVHSSGIIEILSKIYRADKLVKELTGR